MIKLHYQKTDYSDNTLRYTDDEGNVYNIVVIAFDHPRKIDVKCALYKMNDDFRMPIKLRLEDYELDCIPETGTHMCEVFSRAYLRPYVAPQKALAV